MYNINKLIEAGINFKIEIAAEDLKNFGEEIATKSIEVIQEKLKKESDANYITGKKVCEILDISRVTLWHWDKKGITKPIRIGNLKRYRRSDIDTIGQETTK